MGWAVILLPDARAHDAAERVWRSVYNAGFRSMLFEGDNRPHLSLTVLDTQDGTLPDAVRRFALGCRPVTVTFAGIGAFAEDVIYLSPEPAAELYAMNRALAQALGPLLALADNHYMPGQWRPHMTVAFKIPDGDFNRVRKIVRENFTPFRATFGEVAVVKFNPVKIVETIPFSSTPG